MKHLNRLALAAATLAVSLAAIYAATEEKPTRDQLVKLQQGGNYKDAYEGLSALALDKNDDPAKVGEDLTNAVTCLQSINRTHEVDAFMEKVIAAHSGNWKLLWTAARTYQNLEHNGFVISGQFERGNHRGGGHWMNAFERDRVRAMQLMAQAMPLTDKVAKEGRDDVGKYYLELSNMLLANRGWGEAWRLQYLTDLTKLPDYDEGYYGWYGRGYGYGGGAARGAPVDDKGQVIYHQRPKSWSEAATDGQRWRWCLTQAEEFGHSEEARFTFAGFLHNQFGVQTMGNGYGGLFGRQADDSKKNESGPYELTSLGEDETIARLATGIRRFKLPDEFNYIKIYQQLASEGKGYADQSLDALAGIFEDRQQYPKAAEYWKQVIAKFGPGPANNPYRQNRLDQIVKNWGLFEGVMTQPAGAGATVDFRFRNGDKVSFVANEIDVPKLLTDLKAYIKTQPSQLDWERISIDQIGWQLVQNKRKEYLGKEVAKWDLKLNPRPNHFDRRITVATPLQQAGAYLLTATMEGGNTSSIVLWVADTAIVKKPLSGQSYYFVADAVTGQPLPKANVEYFGYRQEWKNSPDNRSSHMEISTVDFAEFTDADGQIFLDIKRQPPNYQYLIIATTPKEQGGRLAYLGFTGAWWYNPGYDAQYNAIKTFVMTDRPVYRPAQPVKFKFWVNQAQYDREGKSPFAGKSFLVRVNDPKNEKVFEKRFTADDYGGFDGELTLSKEATLGQYYIFLPQDNPNMNPCGGGSSFRLEEYKKPEFEVKVEAPKEPVMLGDKVTATIQAKYLFGAPVKEAKVKYKVMRTSYSANWYPIAPWDWFYGPGYWWFCYDYTWYPGWSEWGCKRPIAIWWNWAPPQQPEIVAEAEAPIGADGTVKVEIDTAVAKAAMGDTDHKYEINAEVTDQSRRTIVGSGQVLVARKPFKVYTWVDRGHYRVGDDIQASLFAQTLDSKGVQGKGALKLLAVSYEKDKETGHLKPVETEVQKWNLDTNDEGRARQQIKASKAGQYRLSYTLTDAKGHKIEGGYVFCVIGQGFDGGEFRFNDIELVTDKQQYKPADKVQLMLNTNRKDATIVLFVRSCNGVGLPPKVLRIKGKSVLEQIEVLKKDMPNFFVEAFTIAQGKVHSEIREIAVPPEDRVLKVTAEVVPAEAPAAKPALEDANKFKPGQKAKIKIKLVDPTGEPFVGSTVVTMYDKALEYISGGSNVPDIKEFFWKWRRSHNVSIETSLSKSGGNMVPPGKQGMSFLGAFGNLTAEMDGDMMKGNLKQDREEQSGGRGGGHGGGDEAASRFAAPGAPMAAAKAADGKAGLQSFRREAGDKMEKRKSDASAELGEPGAAPGAQPTIRSNFADAAFWAAAVTTDKDGTATLDVTMPENLTTWMTKVWAMGSGARCGQAETTAITTKNVIIRLQAPRFFVQKDEVVLSANVHNYLQTKKSIKVVLDLGGKTLSLVKAGLFERPLVKGASNSLEQIVDVDAGGEKRVDWVVSVKEPGQAKITMKAITDEESDAMKMEFPVFVHGMLKTESFSGVIRPEGETGTVTCKVPTERMPEQSRLEIRYSPTLAGAMVDALPYMTDYPYGCTEQTLNRFLPTVITQKILLDMHLDLKAIQKKITNLNAQEIGDDVTRAKDWSYSGGYMSRGTAKVKNPVFDEAAVKDMVKAGLERLGSMQCSDGGWGWFSGWGEHSWPHTTALVVHGLQIARANDVAIVPGVLERGVAWLKSYQAEELRRLKLPKDDRWYKPSADNLDAFVYMVLVDEKADNKEMADFLYRDRNNLAVYAKAMFGLACHKVGDTEKRDMLIRNCDQFLVTDKENQTAYLNLGANNFWWCWYGSEYEAQAYYLKLLCATDPKGEKASGLVKYLINNRKHASYWNSTRDTAIVVEALADYLKASGETEPDMTLTIKIDGKEVKTVTINKDNLFAFDNKVVLEGKDVTAGEHKIELVKKGKGPVYFNAYLTNFTLEDFITKAGLEIKVNRKFYKLVEADKKVHAQGEHGQALDQKVLKYDRQELKLDGDGKLPTLKSGDLVEIELTIDSKNDYEYILFEDMKASGMEPVEVRSGYNSNDMGAYMELRDERVSFFVRELARGNHSVSYRMRAEIPGKFSALPTKAKAMYAPELKANSDEFKVMIAD